MILVATLGALAGILAVGLLVLIRKPVDGRRIIRWSGLAVTVAVSAILTPLTVRDAGPAAAVILLGVPVVASALPVLAHRFGRLTRVADLVAAIAIGGWGLLLALGGLGVAFLPSALLFVVSAAQVSPPRPSPAG